MIGPVRALAALAAEAFDAGFVAMSSLVSDRVLDDLRGAQPEAAWRDEIAEHLGAIRALIEDTRNLLASDPQLFAGAAASRGRSSPKPS